MGTNWNCDLDSYGNHDEVQAACQFGMMRGIGACCPTRKLDLTGDVFVLLSRITRLFKH